MPEKKEKPNSLQKFVRKGIRDFIGGVNGTKPEPFINSPSPYTEAWYRNRLSSQLKGKTEVSTPVGRIDILTKTELIEVKSVKNWKNAIGQVKSYGQYYPSHSLRIHLFGQITESKLRAIKMVCKQENIAITIER